MNVQRITINRAYLENRDMMIGRCKFPYSLITNKEPAGGGFSINITDEDYFFLLGDLSLSLSFFLSSESAVNFFI